MDHPNMDSSKHKEAVAATIEECTGIATNEAIPHILRQQPLNLKHFLVSKANEVCANAVAVAAAVATATTVAAAAAVVAAAAAVTAVAAAAAAVAATAAVVAAPSAATAGVTLALHVV